MDRKILTIALTCLAYSPTPDLSSTYLKMGPVVMNMKQYMETSNIPEFERATHNVPTHTLPRQEMVFDFIDDFKAHLKHRKMINPLEEDEYNSDERYKITKQMRKYLEEKAEKVNKEFPITSEAAIFYELAEAVKRKWADIVEIIKIYNTYFRSLDSIKEIATFINFMPLAIYEASKSFPKQDFENIFNIHNLLTVADINKYITEINHEPWMIKISNQALEDAITLIYKLSTGSFLHNERTILIILIHEIRSKYNLNPEHRIHDTSFTDDLLTREWKMSTQIYDHIEIAKAAHEIGNVQMRDKAMNKIWESLKSPNSNTLGWIDFFVCGRIIEIAHEIGNEELTHIALRKAYEAAENPIDYAKLARTAHKIGNTEFANTLLEKAYNEVKIIDYYQAIGEIAFEIGNKEFATKVLAKLYDFILVNYNLNDIRSAIERTWEEGLRNFTFTNVSGKLAAIKKRKHIPILSHYISMTILAHNLNHTEVAQESLNNAFEIVKQINEFNKLMYIATLSHELGNANMAKQAFEKAKALAETDDDKEIIDFLSRYMKTSLIPDADANAEVTQASLNPITRVMSLFYNIV